MTWQKWQQFKLILGLADLVAMDVPRILINREKAGSFGMRKNDIILKGELELIVHMITEKLNWELDTNWILYPSKWKNSNIWLFTNPESGRKIKKPYYLLPLLWLYIYVILMQILYQKENRIEVTPVMKL